ncbi:MAG: arsinothricin resistance N-acetyltransferase ArsN1 family A [Vicinamibacterales bacterium]
MRVTIRAATAADAEAIAVIHNHGIEDRQATLDTAIRTPVDSLSWLEGHGPRHPVLVAEASQELGGEAGGGQTSGATVVAWASLNRFNPRPVYDRVADFSVYVHRSWRGKGVGRQLLGHLIETARTLGYHKMVLAALARNNAGLALYTRAGFTHVGIYREHGQLDGQWIDVLIMEKIL